MTIALIAHDSKKELMVRSEALLTKFFVRLFHSQYRYKKT